MADHGHTRHEVQIIIFDKRGKVVLSLPDRGPVRCLENICPGLERLLDIVGEIRPEPLCLPIVPEGVPCRSIVFRGVGRFNGMYLLIAEGVAADRLASQWSCGCARVVRPQEHELSMGASLRSALRAYNNEHSAEPDARLLAEALAKMVGIALERSDVQGKSYPGIMPDGSLLLVQLLLTFITAKRNGVHRAVMSERSLPHHVELYFLGSCCESDDTFGLAHCRRLADAHNTIFVAQRDKERGGLRITVDACLHNSAVLGIKSDIVISD